MFDDFIIPKTQNVKTLSFNRGRPGVFGLGWFRMLAAIEFDYQTTLNRTKIYDIRSDWILPRN